MIFDKYRKEWNMGQWFYKLERKYGKYAIKDLSRYLVALYCIGAILELANMMGILQINVYDQWLCLNMDAIFRRGQVWRLFTFLLGPYSIGKNFGFVLSVIFFVVQFYLYLLFGRSLERIWGSFRFNLYVFSGCILNIIAALLLYLSPLHFPVYYAGMEYIFQTMFLAFAVYNPDLTFYLNFLIPIKAKWLAIFECVVLGWQVVKNLAAGMLAMGSPLTRSYGLLCISIAVAIIVSVANFLFFFLTTPDRKRVSPREIHHEVHRKKEFRHKVTRAGAVRHQCAICGRNSEDFPQLEFRYCSKCEGNYEYCADHLYTHEHVKKNG